MGVDHDLASPNQGASHARTAPISMVGTPLDAASTTSSGG